MNTTLRHLAMTLGGAVALGCGSDRGTGPAAAGLTVLSGRGASDSVQSASVRIVVEVHGANGKPVTDGPAVEFRVPAGATTDPFSRSAFVCAESTLNCGNLATATATSDLVVSIAADAAGRATARVRFGGIVGATYVLVTVPTLGFRDSVALAVRPGAAATLALVPEDTAVTLGAEFPVHGAVVDRFGNARPETVTLASTSAGLTAAAQTVRATAYGAQELRFAGGSLARTVAVSVVPAGTFVAAARRGGLGVFATDGTSRRDIDLPLGALQAADGHSPSWMGAEIAYQASVDNVSRLFVADAAGASRRFITGTSLRSEAWPRTTPAGRVYFIAAPATGALVVWSAAAANSSDAAPVLVGGQPIVGTRASPASSGGALAWVAPDAGTLSRVVTLLPGGAPVMASVLGTAPRFSPDGSQVAFVNPQNGELWVMAADATGAHRVSVSGVRYGESVDWTGDGKWLLAAQTFASAPIELVNVASGAAAPLPFTRGYSQPAWKP